MSVLAAAPRTCSARFVRFTLRICRRGLASVGLLGGVGLGGGGVVGGTVGIVGTIGALVSTVTGTGPPRVWLPAASTTAAWIWCGPLESVVVSRLNWLLELPGQGAGRVKSHE